MFLSFYSLVSIVTKLYDFKTCETNWRPKFTKYWTSAHPFFNYIDNSGQLWASFSINYYFCSEQNQKQVENERKKFSAKFEYGAASRIRLWLQVCSLK